MLINIIPPEIIILCFKVHTVSGIFRIKVPTLIDHGLIDIDIEDIFIVTKLLQSFILLIKIVLLTVLPFDTVRLGTYIID